MAWTGLTLTVEGRNALNQAQLSKKLKFKSIVVGDGSAPVNFRTQNRLVHQLYELTELKVDMTDSGCILTADFPKVGYDYYFREIGIIAATDSGDKLYVYDNCGEDAQLIVNSAGAETTQKRIRLLLVISDVTEITVSNPGVLYVPYDDFEGTVRRLEQETADAIQNEITRATAAEAELRSAKHMHDNKEILDSISVVNNTADKDKIVAGVAVDGGEASATSNLPRPVWITSSAGGVLTEKRTYSSDFTYVPSTHTLNVRNVNGNAASATNADTVDGKHASDLQDYNNLTNKPTIPAAVAVKGNAESSYRTGSVNLTPANIGLGNVGNFKAVSTVAGQNLTEAEKANARSNIGAGASSFSGSYNDLSNKPTIPAAVAVKGNAESSYRTGNVNLTAENVGALPLSGGTMNSNSVINLGSSGEIKSNYSIFGTSIKEGKVVINDTEASRRMVIDGYSIASKGISDGNGAGGIMFHIHGKNNFSKAPNFKGEMELYSIDGSTGGYFCMYSNSNGGKTDLGTSARKWTNIYATNGVIQTSDRAKKTDIACLTDDKSKAFIMGLTPVSYKMTEGTSGRTHYGLIAQDVEDLMNDLGMDSKDFAGFIKSPKIITKDMDEDGNPLKKPIEEVVEGEYDYALRYDEFIAPLIKVVQIQQREIEELKEELVHIKAEIQR